MRILIFHIEQSQNGKEITDTHQHYIGLKTLEKLINIQDGVDVSIFSDNLVKGLRQNAFVDFSKEYPNLKIQLFHSGGIFHDRYIILDYGTNDEKYFCVVHLQKMLGEELLV